MGARVYVLLPVIHGNPEKVVQILRSQSGVAMADLLEGSADILMMVEAAERQSLARLTVEAIASVEPMLESLQLLPARHEHSGYFCRRPLGEKAKLTKKED